MVLGGSAVQRVEDYGCMPVAVQASSGTQVTSVDTAEMIAGLLAFKTS